MLQAMSQPLKIIEFFKRGIQPMATPSTPNSNTVLDEKGWNEEILPYRVGCLPDSLLEEAKLKLHETDEKKKFCLKELRSLVEKEENLVCPTDDNFLLQFLRARKFNLKRAFKLLQNYFLFRMEYGNMYETSDTEKIQNLILHNFVGFLEHRDRNGSVVVIIKVDVWDPDVYSFQDVFRAMTACLVHAIEDPATQVAGFRLILDTRGLTWKHLKVLTPHNCLLVIRATQFCFPGRYRGIHIFSENRLFNIAWAIIYPCLTAKLKKRIGHHGTDVSCLEEYISRTILPEEFGGLRGPYDNSGWIDVLNENKAKMLDMLRYGYVS